MSAALPGSHEIAERLEVMLARDSANVGNGADKDRLTLMLTRSCELRCSYCFVAVREDGHGVAHDGSQSDAIPIGDLSEAHLGQAIDLLMSSPRPRLALQIFGGEPTRRWDLTTFAIDAARHHADRRGRRLEILLTTNGMGFDPDAPETERRLAFLRDAEVVVELSVDGDRRGNRFRRGHLLTTDAATDRLMRLVPQMLAARVRWFANVTMPPAAAGEVFERYEWARAIGAPALQLNYATGMMWSDASFATYLEELARVLHHHHANRAGLSILNWQNGADPVPLCSDVMIDVDATIVQMGGIFHEKRFSALRAAYRRGALDTHRSMDGLRIPLDRLFVVTREALSPDDWIVFENNTHLGAAVELVVERAKRELGITP